MSHSNPNAFISPLPFLTTRRPGNPARTLNSPSATRNTKNRSPLATASSHTNLSSSTPQPKKSLLNQALIVLVAATATLFPTRVRPTHAAQHATPPKIARAVPTSSPLHSPTSHKPVKLKKPTYDPHATGTSFAVAGTSALLASAVAVAITHPIDTLKTMRQARASSIGNTEMTLPGLYRGVTSNILKEAPNAAIYLATYEVFKTALLRLSFFASVPLLAMCVAGMLGDAVGSVVRVPAEIVNKRLQLGLSNGWNEAIRDSFLSENGVEGTIASWLAVLWRDVPYGGLQIAGYEFVRLVLAGWGLHGLGYSVVAGAIAGLFAAVITTPADVLVTRMSTQSPQCYLETHHYMSPIATLKRIVRDEGFGALWTGAVERGLFYMPMIGLFFAVYEMFKFMFTNSFAAQAMGMNAGMAVLGAVITGFGVAMKMFSTPLQVGLLVICSGLLRRRKRHGKASVKW